MAERARVIVVGVDGSGSSKEALRWAIHQAKLTGAAVQAVTAWRFPVGYGMATMDDDSVIDFETSAKQILTEALAEVSGLDPEVPVRPLVIEGHAGEVLLNAARGAELLVVGSRGHSGFTSALLGSVSMSCVLHARCPVVVVRDGCGT